MISRRYAIVDRRPDMGDVLHEGEYLEIDRPRRLTFTFVVPMFSDEADLVTIEIRPAGDGGCELTLTHEYAPSAEFPEDNVVQGWTTRIDRTARSTGAYDEEARRYLV